MLENIQEAIDESIYFKKLKTVDGYDLNQLKNLLQSFCKEVFNSKIQFSLTNSLRTFPIKIKDKNATKIEDLIDCTLLTKQFLIDSFKLIQSKIRYSFDDADINSLTNEIFKALTFNQQLVIDSNDLSLLLKRIDIPVNTEKLTINNSSIINDIKYIKGYRFDFIFYTIQKIHPSVNDHTVFKSLIPQIINSSVIKFKIDLSSLDEDEDIIEYIDYKPITEKVVKEAIIYLQNKLDKKLTDIEISNLYKRIISNINCNENIDITIIGEEILKLLIQKTINSNATNKKAYPNEWYKLTDEDIPINEELTSKILPTQFSLIRTSPLVVLDNKVLQGEKTDHHNDLINNYREELERQQIPLKHSDDQLAYQEGAFSILEEFHAKNIGIGSAFKDVALLEYVTNKSEESYDEGRLLPNNGDLNLIVNSLKNDGFKKVFIQTNSPWSGNTYERVAKRLMKRIKQ